MVAIWNKEDLSEEWKEPIIAPIYKKSDQTNCGDYKRTSFYQLRTKIYPIFCCQSSLHIQRKLLGIVNVDFDAATDLRRIIYSALVKYLRKNGNTTKAVH
jgi:hypothetical protein